jgi:DNA replication and repair protein RecF
LRDLNGIASARYLELSGSERLRLVYLPGFDPDRPLSESSRNGARQARLADSAASYAVLPVEEVRARMADQLRRLHRREMAAGVSLIGPHRDDLAFIVDEHDLRLFGSRGQQRTAALALKLAELRLMREETGDSPLLLLDDVMSELDATRRSALLGALGEVTQAVVTTTDWADFDPALLRQSRPMRVEAGRLTLAAPRDG